MVKPLAIVLAAVITLATPATASAAQAPACTPDVTTSSPSPAAKYPADVLDLRNWYVTLPSGSQGKPDTVRQPKLATLTNQYFKLNDAKDGVVFTAAVNGATTENSQYPRSELREMNGSELASWDGKLGTHTLEWVGAVLKTPVKKPEVVFAQVHATKDDLMLVMLSGKTLQVKYDDNKVVKIADNYQLGTMFTIRIVGAGGRTQVYYNSEKKFDEPISSSTSYFKAGSYSLSNTSKGDKADAVGSVLIHKLQVTHK